NKEIYHNYGIEGSYGINKWLDVGAFMTYRYFEKQNIQNGNSTTLSINYFKYGAGCNIHVLPLFCDPEYYAFDVYISPRIGIFTALYDKRLSDLDKHVYNGFLYLASLGVAWNFIKNVGIFCEGEYERFDKFGFKAGINIRF
ncbi:MAG: hypothetical protein PHR20_04415, partial [Bacteroidales bacterium]|nr:hypothetical protein [Bacteroidales bacterium]